MALLCLAENIQGYPPIWAPSGNSQQMPIPGHDDVGRSLERIHWPNIWAERRDLATKKGDNCKETCGRIIWHARKYPFEALFRATDAMVTPSFTFDDIDVVITRHSLRNIFDIIGNNNREGFRLNLHLVGIKTLIVEPAEEEHTLDRGLGDLSTACERGFTKKLSHLEGTEGYYRVVRYRIGELQCAVQCEVDACYEEPSPVGTSENLGEEGTLSEESQQSDSATTRSLGVNVTNHDSAEIKTSVSANKGAKIRVVKHALPQLWFGRIAWLIFGRNKGSTVSWHKPRVTTQGAEVMNLDNWAFQERVNLAKLAVVLSELRDQVQNDKRYVTVCPAHSTSLSVYPQQTARGALPEDLLRRFWPPQASAPGDGTCNDQDITKV